MATILSFPDPAVRDKNVRDKNVRDSHAQEAINSASTEEEKQSAKIIIFSGVRFERIEQTETENNFDDYSSYFCFEKS